jgi:hypothetical protein
MDSKRVNAKWGKIKAKRGALRVNIDQLQKRGGSFLSTFRPHPFLTNPSTSLALKQVP